MRAGYAELDSTQLCFKQTSCVLVWCSSNWQSFKSSDNASQPHSTLNTFFYFRH